MSATPFRFVSTDRRVREDRRFVVGKGRFAADVAMAGTRHVAVVTCPHPAAVKSYRQSPITSPASFLGSRWLRSSRVCVNPPI